MTKALFALLAILTSSVYAGDAMRIKASELISKDLVRTKHGTAFAVSPRQVLTCAHNVLPDMKEGVPCGIPLKTVQLEVGSDWIAADVVMVEPEIDLALLRVGQDLPAAGALGEDVDVADDIYICASYRGLPIDRRDGDVLSRYHKGGLKTEAIIQEFDHGGSGSPVYNTKDQIVGMVTSGVPIKPGSDELNPKRMLFVPASVLKWFLKREK